MQLVRWPKQFDVIVTDNLFGDMLSDVAAMLTGSLGMLPSASLGEVDPKTKKRKAMYEPVHGSAPDIAGKGVANPIAMIASFGMALRYSFDRGKEADLIDQAIAATLDKGLRTADIKSEGCKLVGTRGDGGCDHWGGGASREGVTLAAIGASALGFPHRTSALRLNRRTFSRSVGHAGEAFGIAYSRVCRFRGTRLARFCAILAHANHPPDRAVPAGGSNDVMARLIAPHLEKSLGQTIIVDNRPAAAGQVGTEAVARATPDGHTLLLVASSHTVQPALNPKLPYNTETDFAPITLVNTNAMFFFVHPERARQYAHGIRRAREEKSRQVQLRITWRRQPDAADD